MADDDEVYDEASVDSAAPPAERRSTFDPSVNPQPSRDAGSPKHDDDELAAALAADFSRLHSGLIPVVDSSGPIDREHAYWEAMQAPGDDVVAPVLPASSPAPSPAPQPYSAPAAFQPHGDSSTPGPHSAPAAPESYGAPEPYGAPESYSAPSAPEPPAAVAPTPAPEPWMSQPSSPSVADPAVGGPPAQGAMPAEATPAPWSSLPAPDPAQAVSLPDPPARRSLPDEDLFQIAEGAARDPGATLDAIQQLEAQLRLREEEAREFRAWQDNAAASPAPGAASAFDDAGLNPTEARRTPTPPDQFIDPSAAATAWPMPQFDDSPAVSPAAQPVIPEPTAEAAPAVPPPLPPMPVQPASFVQPPFVEPSSEVPVFEVPAFEHDEYGQPEFGVPVFDAPADPAGQAPPPPLPAWEVPAPGPQWSPGPEYDLEEPDWPTEPPAPESVPSAPQSAVGTASFDDLLEERAEGFVHQSEPWASAPPAWQEAIPEPPTATEPPPLIEPAGYGAPVAPVPPPVDPALAGDWPLPVGLAEAPSAGGTAELPTDLHSGAQADEPTADAVAEPPALEPVPPTGPMALIPPPPASSLVSTSFDDLMSSPLEGVPQADDAQRDEAPPATPADDGAAAFVQSSPVTASGQIPMDTGSITIIDQAYEEELPDDVDETDRAYGLGPFSVDTAGIALVGGGVQPPSGPISTIRIPDDEIVLIDNEPVAQKVFSLEESGIDATPVEQRVGRAARLFWLWFATNSSILSLGLGAAVFAVGMSLRQSIVAVLAGIALSFIPLGLTTLAGKRSGQPTMVVSRATFGLLGNVIPAVLALVTRLFWGAVLLWLLASSVTIVLVGAGLDASLGDGLLLVISLAAAFLLALLVALAGYPLFARMQLILSVLSAVLIAGLIVMTWDYVDLSVALSTPDGSWGLTVTGAVLVFSFVGLVWATSGGDLARYQRTGSSGAASMLSATFGAMLPAAFLIGYGVLLAASDPALAEGFLQSPLDTLATLLPSWYPVPLLMAAALSLLSGASLALYSGGFALQAIGVQVRRQWSVVIVAVLLGGLAVLLTFGVTGGMTELFRDAATTLAVPTAAWVGIFVAEMMIRKRRFDSQSLLLRGGVYADVRWVNLIGLLVISAAGFGLSTATVTWLAWQGYIFGLLGIALDSALATSDLGVLVALGLGILLPLIAGVPAIRKQEALRG